MIRNKNIVILLAILLTACGEEYVISEAELTEADGNTILVEEFILTQGLGITRHPTKYLSVYDEGKTKAIPLRNIEAVIFPEPESVDQLKSDFGRKAIIKTREETDTVRISTYAPYYFINGRQISTDKNIEMNLNELRKLVLIH